MTEQEIIKGLECCTKTGIPCVPCPYHTRHCDECAKALKLDALDLINAKNAELKAKDEEIEAIKSERDEARAEVEMTKKRLKHLLESDYISQFDMVHPITREYVLDIQTATGFPTGLPLRIGTTIIDRDEHGEYYMIQCATEQAAQRRMEKCLN